MKRVFLVSLDGTAVHAGHQILGFVSNNNQEIIDNYVDNIYGLRLRHLLPNRFSWQDGCHWEYSTNRLGVDVHVDICHNLDNNENE